MKKIIKIKTTTTTNPAGWWTLPLRLYLHSMFNFPLLYQICPENKKKQKQWLEAYDINQI